MCIFKTTEVFRNNVLFIGYRSEFVNVLDEQYAYRIRVRAEDAGVALTDRAEY